MAVYTAKLNRPPPSPNAIGISRTKPLCFFLRYRSFVFVFRHRNENCPPFACPNRDRRQYNFVSTFLSKIVRTYCDTTHLSSAIVNRCLCYSCWFHCPILCRSTITYVRISKVFVLKCYCRMLVQ